MSISNSIINTPFSLPCGAVLSNRVAKAALTERLAKSDHLPHDGHIRLYDHWARHQAGMLLSGNILVDQRYLESTGNVVIEEHTKPDRFKEWTTAVNRDRLHFWAQLSHAGRQSSRFSTTRPVSASDVQLKKMGLFAKPVALTESGVLDVKKRFLHAAQFCKEVGFTGVQFHAAHGYLLSQFLSPRTNRRTDQWGGSIANRARLLLDIIQESRKLLGKEFPISVKLNSADFQRGGFDEADAKIVIKGLEERGLDLLEISGGTYERSAMMGVGMKESTRSREAYFLDFASEIRKETKLPLMVTGGFRTLSVCEEALEKDELDIVGFGRPFLSVADFPQGFLNRTLEQVVDPKVPVLDKNNADAAEAGYYDLQIKRLAQGKELKRQYSALRVGMHIPKIEMMQGLANRIWGNG